MQIFLGSTNPVKINAVTQAASETWSDVVVTGFEAQSGISDQPRSDEETKLGSSNRAKAALTAGLKQQPETTDCIAIGMEGGVFENTQGEMWNTVWACVVDTTGGIVHANGERFLLPVVLADQIRAGKEMGSAMDELAGTTNIKHAQGMIGIITRGFLDRTEMYAGLAKLALGLWYGREWEKNLHQ